jgi:hypothetical protein
MGNSRIAVEEMRRMGWLLAQLELSGAIMLKVRFTDSREKPPNLHSSTAFVAEVGS